MLRFSIRNCSDAEIGRAAHDAAERVDFAHDRALGDAADRRIARHLADRLERARDDRDARAGARRGDGGLGAGVSRADDDDVERRLEIGVGDAIGHARKATDAISVRGSVRCRACILSPITPTHGGDRWPSIAQARRRCSFGARPTSRSGSYARAIDERLGLTPDEFRVEGDLVAIGPIYGGAATRSATSSPSSRSSASSTSTTSSS